jgi:transcriptional regulator with XRE-family HTH domain
MLSPVKTNIAQKLKNRGYRRRFFRGRAQDEIAYQIKEARNKRNLTQIELEKLSGMKQSAISRIEQSSHSKWNFRTLLRVADALDLRVRVQFDYAETVIREYEEKEIHGYTQASGILVPAGTDATIHTLPNTSEILNSYVFDTVDTPESITQIPLPQSGEDNYAAAL